MESESELQEKIKNMSPDELAEFQKQRCIFCSIIDGKIPSNKVYEDDKCVAILDINPANPGHILLMLKDHQPMMPMVSEEIIGHLAKISKKLSHALLKGLKVQGTNILIQNGPGAGQKAQHFMMHIIPRKDNDNIGLFLQENSISPTDEKQIIANLAPFINKFLDYNNPNIKQEIQEKNEKSIEKNIEKQDKKIEEKSKQDVESEDDEEPEEDSEDDEEPEDKKKDIDLDDIANLLK